jgi:hypothetical protein
METPPGAERPGVFFLSGNFARRYIKKRKGAAKLPFYLNRHENLLAQNVPYIPKRNCIRVVHACCKKSVVFSKKIKFV